MRKCLYAALLFVPMALIFGGNKDGCSCRFSVGDKGLKIEKFQFVESGSSDKKRKAKFKAGETAFLKFRLEGLKLDGKDIRYKFKWSIKNKSGKKVAKQSSGDQKKSLGEKGKAAFLEGTFPIRIPVGLKPGKYKLKVTFKDLVEDKEVSKTKKFEIKK